MIVLFTDFGSSDVYVGQVKAAISQLASSAQIIDLLHEAPSYSPLNGAHLLAAVVSHFPLGTVFFCVIDPGVGSYREAAVMKADGHWFVGPDNGLLSVVAGRAQQVKYWHIKWRPTHISHSFHGRDLFAPIAALIDRGDFPQNKLQETPVLCVNLSPDDLPQIIYVDHYGNAFTGLRAGTIARDMHISVNGNQVPYASVFSDVGEGQALWYENSIGLIEIALNCGNAAATFGLKVGQEVVAHK